MGEALDRNSFFYLQYKRGKVSTGQTDSGFTSVHTFLGILITPTNATFMDYIFTDFFTGFQIFSDSISDQGRINVLQSMYNFSTNTVYIIFDDLIIIPPFPRDLQPYHRQSKIGQGFTVPADGNSYIQLSISSDFVPSTSLKFSGSILYRGVFMND